VIVVPTAGSSAGAAGAAGSAGATGVAGTVAAGGAGGAGGTTVVGPAVKPPCITKPNQVHLIGDSYINYTAHTFPQDLSKAAGQTFTLDAIPGFSMASGGLGLIPDQWPSALAGNKDILAVIMDGGGNDILLADPVLHPGGAACKDDANAGSTPVCQEIVTAAVAAGSKLMMQMSTDGVQDIVFFFYPHIPGGGLIGGRNPNASLDYALPLAKANCDGAEAATGGKTRCHFLNLVPLFEGHADWFSDDGVHENSKGSAAMATAIVALMKDQCIAQPAESGCCTP
jgi:hypothetical protein